jgi:hypothetical protein
VRGIAELSSTPDQPRKDELSHPSLDRAYAPPELLGERIFTDPAVLVGSNTSDKHLVELECLSIDEAFPPCILAGVVRTPLASLQRFKCFMDIIVVAGG